jgi:hypothetical protein
VQPGETFRVFLDPRPGTRSVSSCCDARPTVDLSHPIRRTPIRCGTPSCRVPRPAPSTMWSMRGAASG